MRTIVPRSLSGSLRVMPSKSASHRALLCAALARGESAVAPLQLSQDVEATLACVQGMGLAEVLGMDALGDAPGFMRCRVLGKGCFAPAGATKGLSGRPLETFGEPSGVGGREGEPTRLAPCGESGSTLRFLMPLALDGGSPVRFEGKGRLLERPLDVYRQLFAAHAEGLEWIDEPGAITLRGTLRAGEYVLPGDVSSQFVSGLLFALPRLAGDSTIRLTGAVESRAYIDLTLAALARSGIEAEWLEERTLRVPGGQSGSADAYAVEGDWSHAGFYLVAGLMGGPVRLTGLDAQSLQGDRAAVEVLRRMGGDIVREGDAWIAKPSALHGTVIDASQIPDLVPPLAIAACAAHGRTEIRHAERLRIKECDRLAALDAELTALGASITELPDGLIIEGGSPLRGGAAQSHNDHRIAMALAIAATLCESPIELTGDEAVRKSAPAFWQEYASLGGEAHARTMG